jgi:signal transduction histidine kinase
MEQLDVLSVTKASQTISGEIVLDELIRTLLKVVLEQGGAQRAHVLLCERGALWAAAEASIGEKGVVTSVLASAPPDIAERVPASLIQYVTRTGEDVILSESTGTSRFSNDEYFLRHKPKSVLCLPVRRQAELVGLLYLENDLIAGAFTSSRLAALRLLATQAAVSVENALLLAKERSAREAAEDAVRAQTEFLQIASHELHTPVTSLVLAVDLMRRAAPSGRPLAPEKMDRLLDRVMQQSARLTRLSNDLLDVTRLDADRLPLHLTDVDLASLVGEVVERFEVDLAQSRATVSLSVSHGPIVGRWDRSRIDQVFTNLLSNAIKFGAGKPIEVVLDQDARCAHLTVRDHGIGIAREEKDRIFGRFERAVSVRHYGGLGLGLYITRRIVERHGGSIRCESDPGRGATFVVSLPLASPPAIASLRT